MAVGMSFRTLNTATEETVKEAEVEMYEEKAKYYQNKEIAAVPDLESRLNAIFDIMEYEERGGFAPNDPFLQSVASSVYFLLERYFSESYNIFSEERDRQDFYKVIEYVNAHFKEDITVETISKSLSQICMRGLSR